MLASCGSNIDEVSGAESEAPLIRYDMSKTSNPTDTLMYLKADMKPLNGVVFCEFGDIGKYVNGKKEGVQKSYFKKTSNDLNVSKRKFLNLSLL